jgi:hypothetical protein
MLRELLSRIRDFFLPKRALMQNPSERRQLVRVRCRIPIQMRLSERTAGGWILDMGVQGIRVRTNEPLKKGLILPVRATLSQQANQVWVNCRVMWSRPASDGKYYLAGARFHETRENLRKTWVHRLLRELGLNENSLRERREFIRVDGRVPARMQSLKDPSGGGQSVETLNLGVAGLLLRTTQPLYPGEQYRCWIGPWGKLPEVGPIPAEVLSCRPDPAGSASQVPLRFLELEEDDVRELGRYVLTLLKEV